MKMNRKKDIKEKVSSKIWLIPLLVIIIGGIEGYNKLFLKKEPTIETEEINDHNQLAMSNIEGSNQLEQESAIYNL